jgi:hypothetical protein
MNSYERSIFCYTYVFSVLQISDRLTMCAKHVIAVEDHVSRCVCAVCYLLCYGYCRCRCCCGIMCYALHMRESLWQWNRMTSRFWWTDTFCSLQNKKSGFAASESESYVTTDGQPASLSWSKAPIWGLRPDLYYMCDSYGLVLVGRPLWREVGYVLCICCWPLPAQSFSGPSPLELETIFYCLTFETSLFVASYDSQGHGGGIRPRLHTGSGFAVGRLYLYMSVNGCAPR